MSAIYGDMTSASGSIEKRELTDEELAELKIMKAKLEADNQVKAEAAEKKAAAEAKLAALGFTSDDLKALGL